MRWVQKLNESIKRGLRSWLNVVPANPYSIQINEVLDFETNAIRNRIWYRGIAMSWSRCTSRIQSMRTSLSSGHVSAALGWKCVRSYRIAGTDRAHTILGCAGGYE